jgi:two-component system chemotaxis response regulator CheB
MASYSSELLSKIRRAAPRKAASPEQPVPPRSAVRNASSLIAIGASTGGPAAVTRILQDLPADSPPVVIAIHMPMPFTGLYADRLTKVVKNLRISHASHRESLRAGTAYITPGNQHLIVENERGSGLVCHLQSQNRDDLYRPSIDKLFTSVARASGAAAVACILTGMGNDGAAGARAIFDAGGYVLAQDETSSAIYGMPRVVQNGGYAHRQLPLDAFSDEITQALQQRSTR